MVYKSRPYDADGGRTDMGREMLEKHSVLARPP